VVSVHCSFGLALHMGQRTERMCRKVRGSEFTLIVSNIVRFCGWSILLFWISSAPKQEPQKSHSLSGSLTKLFDLFQRNDPIYGDG
jgi:hypothetical protein